MLEGVETTVRLNLPGHDIPALSGIVEGSRTKWRFQPHALEISYGWYSVVGYWRVIGSKAIGKALTSRAPTDFTWLNHDPGKPLWVTVLEHKYYPKGNPNDQR